MRQHRWIELRQIFAARPRNCETFVKLSQNLSCWRFFCWANFVPVWFSRSKICQQHRYVNRSLSERSKWKQPRYRSAENTATISMQQEFCDWCKSLIRALVQWPIVCAICMSGDRRLFVLNFSNWRHSNHVTIQSALIQVFGRKEGWAICVCFFRNWLQVA